MKVRNMTSPRSGREVANQFIITDAEREVFQSYRTTIAVRDYSAGATRPHITLDVSALDYSVTTSRYLYQFLHLAGAYPSPRRAVQDRIASGQYAVADLNTD